MMKQARRDMPWWWVTGLAVFAAAQFAPLPATRGDVKLPAIFGDHMVLQQGQPNRVWGWADDGEQVTVTIAGQTHAATAAADGRWQVQLGALTAGGPHELTVQGKNTKKFSDVLVGEVWVCSGQSNMWWTVNLSKDPDLETKAAAYPQIRLVTVPPVGTQEPQRDFNGQWKVCAPETVGDFSAVGYFFGRQLHETLHVPVGLINNSWGGSSCEAWVPRDLLEKDEHYKALMERWVQTEKTYDHARAVAEFQKKLKEWEEKAQQAKQQGQQPPQRPAGPPDNPLTNQHRPGNLYNGLLYPVIGYGIRGAIWYQGESNAGRAYQYRHLFPLMIQSWRDAWGQGDFAFYWVQLADFMQESPEPRDSAWAELREAQTMTMSKLAKTGEAVIIDLGEANDIHPKNKQDVAKRLARWALARDYGVDAICRSPLYKSMEKQGKKILVTFDVSDKPAGALTTFDVGEVKGFTIAGADRKFVWAKAKIVGRDQVEVSSDAIDDPVAVRYAWADNPVCNLQNRAGLPATPFRTDGWPGATANAQ